MAEPIKRPEQQPVKKPDLVSSLEGSTRPGEGYKQTIIDNAVFLQIKAALAADRDITMKKLLNQKEQLEGVLKNLESVKDALSKVINSL